MLLRTTDLSSLVTIYKKDSKNCFQDIGLGKIFFTNFSMNINFYKFFRCNCVACFFNWPVYDKMNTEIKAIGKSDKNLVKNGSKRKGGKAKRNNKNNEENTKMKELEEQEILKNLQEIHAGKRHNNYFS